MNKFEQLIEYVINDDTQKAQELFHEIVVEKSRQIYEDIMSEEEIDEAEEGEDLEEADMGGDAADDLIDDVEAEEQDDMNMEAAGDDEGMDDMGDGDAADDMGGDDFGGNEGGSDEAATKDDIMNLEDKLDQLMAEFEDLMGGGDADMGDGDGFGPDEGGDAIEMDDTEEMEPGMMESLDLKAAPKPVTSEEGSVNKKSTVAANAGAKGPIGNSVKPVRTGSDLGGHHDASPYKNTVKEIGTPSTQEAGKKAFKTAAPKPVTGQASGVNNRSITPGGRG
jgi:hypothetical protein